MELKIFFENEVLPEVFPCFNCSVSCSLGQPPIISANLPKNILPAKNIVGLEYQGFKSDFTGKRTNIDSETLEAGQANILQKIRIDLSLLSGSYTALALLITLCSNLGITLVYNVQEVSRLNYSICYTGFTPDFALNIINLICNYFGYSVLIMAPDKIKIVDFSFFYSVTCAFSELNETTEENRYNSLVLSRVSPNAQTKTFSFAKKIGKDAGEWQNPNIHLIEGTWEQNDGLTVEEYKQYMQGFEIDFTDFEFNPLNLSINCPLSAKSTENNKYLFQCAPALDKFLIMREQNVAKMASYGSFISDYQADFNWYAVFSPPSWIAGRNMYSQGNSAEPFFNVSSYCPFFSNETGQNIISSRSYQTCLGYGDPKTWYSGWIASTLDPSDPKYNNPSVHYPNIVQYPTNTIDFIDLPGRENWPYWHLTRNIIDHDDNLSLTKTGNYGDGQSAGSFVNTWQYCRKIQFSKALWSSGFSNIAGISAADCADSEFFNPRTLIANNKDCFFQGAGTPQSALPGESNMAKLPEIKYQVKIDDNYKEIFLAPGRVKMAARLKWGYGKQKNEYFTSSAPSFMITALGPAKMTAQELTAVQAGAGESASADLSYTIGQEAEDSYNIVSFVWNTRQAAEAAYSYILPVLAGSNRKISYKTPEKNVIIGKKVIINGAAFYINKMILNEYGAEGEGFAV